MQGLFDGTIYRDPDYHAACMLVAEITGGDVSGIELLPGVPSSDFCPIALTLDALYNPFDDVDLQRFLSVAPDERTRIMESVGGSSYLFEVGPDRVIYPASDEWSIDLLSMDDYPPPEQVDVWAEDGFVFDDSGADLMRLAHEVSSDAWGPSVGSPGSFIERFDAGEFQSLHLPTV